MEPGPRVPPSCSDACLVQMKARRFAFHLYRMEKVVLSFSFQISNTCYHLVKNRGSEAILASDAVLELLGLFSIYHSNTTNIKHPYSSLVSCIFPQTIFNHQRINELPLKLGSLPRCCSKKERVFIVFLMLSQGGLCGKALYLDIACLGFIHSTPVFYWVQCLQYVRKSRGSQQKRSLSP